MHYYPLQYLQSELMVADSPGYEYDRAYNKQRIIFVDAWQLYLLSIMIHLKTFPESLACDSPVRGGVFYPAELFSASTASAVFFAPAIRTSKSFQPLVISPVTSIFPSLISCFIRAIINISPVFIFIR
jgi:hypothetical protein